MSTTKTMEQILEQIREEHGKSALRDGQRLTELFVSYSGSQLKSQSNVLRMFLECRGNERILNLQNVSDRDRKTEYDRLIREMIDDYNMQEAAAREMCAAFWKAAIGTEPPTGGSASGAGRKNGQSRNSKGGSSFKWRRALLLIIIIGVVWWGLDRFVLPDTTPEDAPAVVRQETEAYSVTRDRAERTLAPFNLPQDVQELVEKDTMDRYSYPDGSCLELYFDDSGKELCRIYAGKDGSIANLFAAEYDAQGRIVRQQVYDGQGVLLRTDENVYEADGSIQRTVSLPDGRTRQGVSTFDEAGIETFSGTDSYGYRFVYAYNKEGVQIQKSEWDPQGNVLRDWYYEEKEPLYGPRNRVIGEITGNGENKYAYVVGICGDFVKCYYSSDEYDYVDDYDMLGRCLDSTMFDSDGVPQIRDEYLYDEGGAYAGREWTYFNNDPEAPTSRIVTRYNQDDVAISGVSYDKEGNIFDWSETDLDDQGREKVSRTYNGADNSLYSLDEWEYDQDGNVQKQIRTVYSENGGYSVFISDGDGKTLSSTFYYPGGQVQSASEYNGEGKTIKSVWYYESGQIESVDEYNGEGKTIKSVQYYESGQIESVDEYNGEGKTIKSVRYYENGQMEHVTEYNQEGEISKMTSYYENGQIKFVTERNAQGEITIREFYDENGNPPG